MKINKIIFISYFSLIGAFLISLLIMGFVYVDEVKDVHYRGIKKEDLETIKQDIQPYKHLYVKENCNVILKGSENYQLTHIIIKEKDTIRPVYELKHDTLFIISTANNSNNWLTLNVDKIHSINGKRCKVTIDHLKQDSLSILLEKSRLQIRNKTDINSLDLTLNDKSDFRGFGVKFSGVNIKIHKSKAHFRTNMKTDSFSGEITDSSDVRLPQSKHLQLNVDETSKVKMY